jgi:pimeloyl-ACP methyl ester carboxylesterase
VVLGHSWGTIVALALAQGGKLDVRGLVLVSGYYFPTARADVALFSGPAIPVIGDVMRYTVSAVLARLMAPAAVRRIFEPAPVSPHFGRFPLELSLRPSQLRATAADTALMIPSAASLRPGYGGLDVPTAIVTGSGDKIVDVDRQARRMHETIEGSDLDVVEGAGHMVHYTAPERVLAAIRRVEAAATTA